MFWPRAGGSMGGNFAQRAWVEASTICVPAAL
jgi:hypothetical protein